MPPDLLAAHRAVLAVYGLPANITESDCVAELFKLYQTLAADSCTIVQLPLSSSPFQSP